MTLLSDYNRYFTATTRQQGDDYFFNDRIEVIASDDTSITALIKLRTESFVAKLEVADTSLKASCQCPGHGKSKFCRHIWALLTQEWEEGVLEIIFDDPRTLVWGPQIVAYVSDDDEDDEDDEEEDYFEYDDFDDYDDFDEEAFKNFAEAKRISQIVEDLRRLVQVGHMQATPQPSGPPPPLWERYLNELGHSVREVEQKLPDDIRIAYVIYTNRMVDATIRVQVQHQERLKSGAWGKIRKNAGAYSNPTLNPIDKSFIAELAGVSDRATAEHQSRYYHSVSANSIVGRQYHLHGADAIEILPRLCATGQCWLGIEHDTISDTPCTWDSGAPWRFALRFNHDSDSGFYMGEGVLRRDDLAISLDRVQQLLKGGLAVFGELLGRFDDGGCYPYIRLLRQAPDAFWVRENEVERFIKRFLSLPALPESDFPEAWGITQDFGRPKPQLIVTLPQSEGTQLSAHVAFAYDENQLPATSSTSRLNSGEARRLLLRDRGAERIWLDQLAAAPCLDGHPVSHQGAPFLLPAELLSELVEELCMRGWEVLAEQKPIRAASDFTVEVSSGIDWFDLTASVDFGEFSVGLPELLKALRQRSHTVTLGDGSSGLLPERWLKDFGLLEQLGKEQKNGTLRLTNPQALLLDAALPPSAKLKADARFTEVRRKLHNFHGIQAATPGSAFHGDLRPYQRDGLGWMNFLCDFGLGGCLADDMGLGKTVQVLALLAELHLGKKPPKTPSLIVVPNSLLYNWQTEAARFVPDLKVLVHAGGTRETPGEHFLDYHIVLTTYGLILRDIDALREICFTMAILDEAQAIKNSATKTSKAVRTLESKHRLALSGTPVENHLGELWSLIEFLNPGLLGKATTFQRFSKSSADAADSGSSRGALAHALRPILLRRTKEQVAKDLPEKIEQTLYCELDDDQQRLYNELRDHYRAGLLNKIKDDGIGQSKIQVLEALLRLRQAACHPGLIDKARSGDASAKLDLLLPSLDDIIAEGHKALVFSQFTTFLGIVRQRLDANNIPYAYLDGQCSAKARSDAVDRFQQDPACPLFLISLKAGGLGLNLTAADYVYLLDPWWNPAVERQAIDRTHRIGQTRQVIACRIIARNTVEEKVLQLQAKKRELADAIFSGDDSLLRTLEVEDLQLLLS